MFFSSTRELLDIVAAGLLVPEPLSSWARRMALIESFAIHARNLILFLYPGRVCPGDVLAEDFFTSSGDWERCRPAKSTDLDEAVRRANKEIVHLTMDRIAGTPAEKAWNVPGLPGALASALRAFAQQARPDRLHPDVAAKVLLTSPASLPPVVITGTSTNLTTDSP